ncbi:RNA-directed DNA polymerase, partial [Striga asiatica]
MDSRVCSPRCRAAPLGRFSILRARLRWLTLLGVCCAADVPNALSLLRILAVYQSFTGQRVNLAKSNVFFSRNASEPTLRAEVNELPLQWVKELLTDDGRAWNRDIIHNMFTDVSCKAILDIKGLDPAENDRWLWKADAKGA